jgi:hypothetical protein
VGNTAGEDWYFVRRDYFIRSRNENIYEGVLAVIVSTECLSVGI